MQKKTSSPSDFFFFAFSTDANQQSEEAVRRLTDTDKVNGEELLQSEELKRQHREIKERLEKEKRRP